MLNVVLLAFVAALYPTLLAGVIVMLTRPKPKPLLVGFLLGGLLISVSSGLIVLFVLQGAVSTSHQRAASPTIDLIAGVLSLVLAGVLWARRNVGHLGERHTAAGKHWAKRRHVRQSEQSREPITKRMLSRDSVRAAFGVGVILNLPGIWYLVALKDIAKDNDGTLAAVLLIFLFNAIMFLLVEVPLAGYLISPDRTTAKVKRFQSWLTAHARLVATVAALVVGVYLIIKAIIEFS